MKLAGCVVCAMRFLAKKTALGFSFGNTAYNRKDIRESFRFITTTYFVIRRVMTLSLLIWIERMSTTRTTQIQIKTLMGLGGQGM